MIRKTTLTGLLIGILIVTMGQQTGSRKYPSLLWEISGNGLKAPSFLFGTMHVSSKMAFHLSDSFYNSLRAVDVVALELDPVRWQDQMYLMQDKQRKLRLFSQQFPADYVNEKSYQLENYDPLLRRALSEEPTALNSLLYRTYRPQSDFEEDTYLDLYIFQTGRKMGKRSTGVEDFFQTEKLIMEAYQDMATEKKKKTAMYDDMSSYELVRKSQDAYRKGDLDQLDSLEKLTQRSEAFMEKFMYVRNEIQAHSIDTILRRHRLFAGVGAAHLPGERGVIELLRKKGYTLRPVFMHDRDARQKEEIDVVRVPVVFRNFREEYGLFSADVPGILYRKEEGRSNTSWQYADMSNGSYYMVTRVPTYAQLTGQSADAVLKKTDSVLYENIPGKIISSIAVVRNGFKGREVVNRTRRGDMQKYLILATPFELMVFKMSGPGDYVAGEEGKRFFSSIKLPEEAAVDNPSATQVSRWGFVEPPRGGFKVRMPGTVIAMRNSETPDGADRWEFPAFDKTTGNGYVVWKKTLKQFRFLEEDTVELAMMEESLKRSESVKKRVSKEYTLAGKVWQLNSRYQLSDGSFLMARFMLKGNDYYTLLAHSPNAGEKHGYFLSSFSFVPYRYNKDVLYRDTILQIEVSTPVLPGIDEDIRAAVNRVSTDAYRQSIPDNFSYMSVNKFALFNDEETGESVFVNMEEYPRYYQPRNLQEFWKEELQEEEIRKVMVMEAKEKLSRQDGSSGYRMVFSDTNSTRQLEVLFLLQQNRLYRVIRKFEKGDEPSAFIRNFFATFRPLMVAEKPQVMDSKTDLFFNDFYSKDSLTAKRAKIALMFVRFDAQSLGRLKDAISTLPYNTKDYFQTKSALIRELGSIQDSVVRGEVLTALNDIFKAAGDTTVLQNAVLEALSYQLTTASYRSLKNLLLENPPVYEDVFEYDSYFRRLSDSLALSASLFPDLLELATVEDYKTRVHELLMELSDSGFVKGADYARFFNQLYVDARIELKKLQVKDERRLSADQDDEDYRNNNEEDVESLPVYRYAVLLMPFYKDHESVRGFFDRLIRTSDQRLATAIAERLLKNEHEIPAALYEQLAASDQVRARWYKALEQNGLASKFPARYATQERIAQSLLLEYGRFNKFHKIENRGKARVSFGGKTGFVYFFAYKVLPDDEWMIGLSGIQPLAEKKLSVDAQLVSQTGKKLVKGTPEEEQFLEQLLRLIYGKRVVSAEFFTEGR